MKPAVVAIDRIVLDGVTLPPAQAEAFRASLSSRLAEALRGWSGPDAGGGRARLDAGDVAASTASDPEALSREVATRVARFLREAP